MKTPSAAWWPPGCCCFQTCESNNRAALLTGSWSWVASQKATNRGLKNAFGIFLKKLQEFCVSFFHALIVKWNARPPFSCVCIFPPCGHFLGLQGQGHAHLRIIRHVLNRRASPLWGRDPTILKQRTGIKEMRGTLGRTHTNTHIQPSGTVAKARGHLLDLEVTRALLLNREGNLAYTLSGGKSLVNDEATPKEVKFTQSGLFDFSLWNETVDWGVVCHKGARHFFTSLFCGTGLVLFNSLFLLSLYWWCLKNSLSVSKLH